MTFAEHIKNEAAVGKAMTSAQLAALGTVLVTAAGMTVKVPAFSIGGYSFSGGTITMPAAGVWYVGVEIYSGAVRCLPRLGHRGWIPLAKVECTATEVSSIAQIAPAIPPCRIPRTMAKILAGQAISVVIMGSSLTQSGGAATDWAGMVFGAGTLDKYKLPTVVNTQYTGVGASPNQYQLAMAGFGSRHSGGGIGDSGWPGPIDTIYPPNGRSNLFSGVDLVVLGCLANGGDYRLEIIEPLVRKLRHIGVEVLLVTDNPQNPSTDYSAMSAAALYIDGPTVMRVADLYGVELADTAAYVFDAHLRAGGTGIYGDTIHQATGIPAGPSAVLPANGHEAWARAVRSTFHAGVTINPPSTTTFNYDFSSDVGQWYAYADGSMAASGGSLVTSKKSASAGQWGAMVSLGKIALNSGDTVVVSGTIVSDAGVTPSIGLQPYYSGGGWSSNSTNVTGQFSVTLTATKAQTDPQLLLFGQPDNAPQGAKFSVTNLKAVVTAASTNNAFNALPGRAVESKPLPPIRVVTDLKTPGDAFVILPKDEKAVSSGNAAKGTLGAHPWGAGSFSRRFASYVSATSDLLLLAVGQKAYLSGPFAVGYALIHYREAADGPCTFTVSMNSAVKKTITISTPPFANEWFLPIFTPTELGVSTLDTGNDTYEITVTDGTLKIAALVALTPDLDYVPLDRITYIGTGWLPKETTRSGVAGRPTDTMGDMAMVRCTGRRVAWMLSSNPGSKIADFFSGSAILQAVDTTGNYHVRGYGKLLGPGTDHYVRCAAANASGSQANGHALNVSGAIIINDR